jgi:hypothetical protein
VRPLTLPRPLPRVTLRRPAVWAAARWSAEPAVTTLAVVLLALVVRLPFFLESDFPLNDGGLFFVMSREIAAAHYALPAATGYNGDQIPFAYPPLPFYLAGFLAQMLDVSALAVVRYLPLVANLLTTVVFVALARSVLPAPRAAFFAAAAFVLVPRSYEWLVMGGGLTRSLGLLFAVAALAQAVALYQRPTAWRIVAAGGLAALTVLSHLEMGLFVAYSYALFFLAYGRGKRGLGVSAGLALIVLGMTAPWWLTVVRYHGVEPFRPPRPRPGGRPRSRGARRCSTSSFPPRSF